MSRSSGHSLASCGVVSRGFTLIELLVTMTILAVLLGLAAPSMQSAYLSNKLSSYSNTLQASIQLARSEAVKRNKVVSLCRSSNGLACTTTGNWRQGWLVFEDENKNGVIDGSDSVLRVTPALSDSFSLTTTATYVAFFASGMLDTSLIPSVDEEDPDRELSFTLCKTGEPSGTQYRLIRILATGRSSVHKMENALTCT